MAKNIVLWVVVALVLMSAFSSLTTRNSDRNPVTYSQFVDQVKSGSVERVQIQGNELTVFSRSGQSYEVYAPRDDRLIDDLLSNGVEIDAKPPEGQSFLMQILISSFPILLLIAVYVYFMRQMQGGGGKGGIMPFGKSRARLLNEDQIRTTFADVAGVDEAKEEVHELVEFLRDPGKFQRLGGHLPRGVMMVGSPGTGKTLR